MAESDDLKALQRRLKDAGNRGLTRELNKAITNAINPVKRALPASALRRLPRRGGLAKRVADSRITVSKRNFAVRLTMKNAYALEKMDDPGIIRHPVFPRRSRIQRATGRNRGSSRLNANRKKWAWESQRIRPGWASIPLQENKAQAKREIEEAMQRVFRQIEG